MIVSRNEALQFIFFVYHDTSFPVANLLFLFVGGNAMFFLAREFHDEFVGDRHLVTVEHAAVDDVLPWIKKAGILRVVSDAHNFLDPQLAEIARRFEVTVEHALPVSLASGCVVFVPRKDGGFTRYSFLS